MQKYSYDRRTASGYYPWPSMGRKPEGMKDARTLADDVEAIADITEHQIKTVALRPEVALKYKAQVVVLRPLVKLLQREDKRGVERYVRRNIEGEDRLTQGLVNEIMNWVRFDRMASVAEVQIPLHYEGVIAVGKKVFSPGRVHYWYQLKNGAKMVYTNREKFRYQLRNQAQVPQAEKLVRELEEKLPG